MFLIHPCIYDWVNVIFSPHKHLPLHPPSLIFSINQIYDLTKVNCFRSIPYLAGNLVYTTYQTNSFKIIKSTFTTYELPHDHAPVIFSINFDIFNCFEIPTEPNISDKLCRFTAVILPTFGQDCSSAEENFVR